LPPQGREKEGTELPSRGADSLQEKKPPAQRENTLTQSPKSVDVTGRKKAISDFGLVNQPRRKEKKKPYPVPQTQSNTSKKGVFDEKALRDRLNLGQR